jgi:hypothetical protein
MVTIHESQSLLLCQILFVWGIHREYQDAGLADECPDEIRALHGGLTR